MIAIRNIGRAIFLSLFFSVGNALASNADDIAEDLKEKLTLTEIAGNIDLKIKEHIRESYEYRYKSSTESLRVYNLLGENFGFGIDEEDFQDDIRRDIVDSAKYGIEHSARDLQLYTALRQWLLGLLTIQVDKPIEKETVIIENISINRPLSYYDEMRNRVDFECDNIVGKSAESLRKRISCFEAEVFIKRAEGKIYNFRLRPGVNFSANLNSNLVAPSGELYTKVRLKKIDAKLSYSVPVTIHDKRKRKDRSPFDDFIDAFFDDRKKRDRFQIKLDRYFISDSITASGDYQFERHDQSHFINIGLSYIKYPFRINARASANIAEAEPIVALSLERIIARNIVVRLGGFTERTHDKDWEYQIAGTAEIIW